MTETYTQTASSMAPGTRKLLVVVDRSSESEVAMLYACYRALVTGARISLLAVTEPADFQHWKAVEDRMEAEARQEAERALFDMAGVANRIAHQIPELMIMEGSLSDAVKSVISGDHGIKLLVLATATGKDGPGPLISQIAGDSNACTIPVVIVPGSWTEEEIRDYT